MLFGRIYGARDSGCKNDLSGNIVKTSQGTVQGEDDTAKANTDRDIYQLENGGFWATVRNAPNIDMYDSNMDYIKSFDISRLDILGDRIKQIEEQQRREKKPNTVYYIFSDSYYSGDKLYILCYLPGDEQRYIVNYNVIIEMELADNDLMHVRNIKLPGRWYTSICVTPDHEILTAANALDASIEQYRLN